MATTRVKNVSGADREVPLPNGGYVIVPAGKAYEFDAGFAQGLLAQEGVWRTTDGRTPAAKQPAATKRAASSHKQTEPAAVAEDAKPAPAESGDGEVTNAGR